MKANFLMTEEEYINYAFDNMIRSKQIIRAYTIQKLVTILLAILFVIAFKGYFQADITFWIIIISIGFVVWTILEAILIRLIAKNFLRRTLKDDDSPLRENYIELNDKYIETKYGKFYYINITFIDYRKDYILIVIRNEENIIVPIRYLENPLEFYERLRFNYERFKKVD